LFDPKIEKARQKQKLDKTKQKHVEREQGEGEKMTER
jgi:hypothetical protein